jgi:hypothetical protein
MRTQHSRRGRHESPTRYADDGDLKSAKRRHGSPDGAMPSPHQGSHLFAGSFWDGFVMDA